MAPDGLRSVIWVSVHSTICDCCLLNQGATWLEFLGRDMKATFQMNDIASLLNNSVKRVRTGKWKGQWAWNPHWSWLRSWKVLRNPRPHPMHASPMTGLPETPEAERRQKDELPKRKIIILTSHVMDVESCLQGIMYGDDYFIFKNAHGK